MQYKKYPYKQTKQGETPNPIKLNLGTLSLGFFSSSSLFI